MERRPKLSDDEYAALIERNRSRYAANANEQVVPSGRPHVLSPSGFEPDAPSLV
jgi:hypothetical protein